LLGLGTLLARYNSVQLKGQWVRFTIRDVYHPPPEKLLCDLYGDTELRGEIVELSNSGTQGEKYAVIQAEGIKQWVIVPVDRIRGVI